MAKRKAAKRKLINTDKAKRYVLALTSGLLFECPNWEDRWSWEPKPH
jgi:hypothetical protein